MNRRIFAVWAMVCSCGAAAPGLAQSNDCPTPINGSLKGEAGNDQDNMFHSLVIDPGDANTVYVSTETNGIFKTSDGGASWTRLRNGLKCTTARTFYPEIYDMAVDPLNRQTVYAATVTGPASPESFPSASAGVYKSVDGGQTWVQKNAGLPNTYVSQVLVDSTHPGRIYAVVGGLLASFPAGSATFHNGGLYVSDNGGDSWSALTLPAGAERNTFENAVLTGPDRRTIYLSGQVHQSDATQAFGFMRSSDAGASWTVSNPAGQIIRGFDFSKQNPNLIYANAVSGSRVRKSTDGGSTWDSTGPTIFFGTPRVHPTNDNVVFYPGSPNGSIWRTTDGFASVQQVNSDATLASGQIVADIEIAPSNPNVIWVAVNGYYLYRSVDGGTSWTKITAVRDAVYGAAPAAPTAQHVAAVGPVAFSTVSARQSFVRIANILSTAGTAEIVVRDDLGAVLGSYTRQVAAFSAPQIAMGDIEANARSQPPARAGAFAQIEVRGDFSGYLQHVTYDPASGVLVNRSLCRSEDPTGVATEQSPAWAINVHTTHPALAGFPAAIALFSGEVAAAAAVLQVYDGATGAALGSWTSPSIAPSGAAIVPVSRLQQEVGLTPTATQYHLNLRLMGSQRFLLGHLVTSTAAGVESDMSHRCAF
jgi:photosystem II stability/assembly factor-like uncharacterized protein